jgi:hypothetical protein
MMYGIGRHCPSSSRDTAERCRSFNIQLKILMLLTFVGLTELLRELRGQR